MGDAGILTELPIKISPSETPSLKETEFARQADELLKTQATNIFVELNKKGDVSNEIAESLRERYGFAEDCLRSSLEKVLTVTPRVASDVQLIHKLELLYEVKKDAPKDKDLQKIITGLEESLKITPTEETPIDIAALRKEKEITFIKHAAQATGNPLTPKEESLLEEEKEIRLTNFAGIDQEFLGKWLNNLLARSAGQPDADAVRAFAERLTPGPFLRFINNHLFGDANLDQLKARSQEVYGEIKQILRAENRPNIFQKCARFLWKDKLTLAFFLAMILPQLMAGITGLKEGPSGS